MSTDKTSAVKKATAKAKTETKPAVAETVEKPEAKAAKTSSTAVMGFSSRRVWPD